MCVYSSQAGASASSFIWMAHTHTHANTHTHTQVDMLRREEQEAELAQEHVRRLMQEILEAKEARTAQLASHTEAVAELDASKRALEEQAMELEEELKTLKVQEKIEREHARVELAQLKKVARTTGPSQCPAQIKINLSKVNLSNVN